jgi:hypothetical protein
VWEAIDEQRPTASQAQIDDWAHYERSTRISQKHETHHLDETHDIQRWGDYQHRSGRY